MARTRGEGDNESNVPQEADLDSLFQLPLVEFTVARNALAARLKKAGRPDEAERVKALSKPSVSAWVVNQLFWRYRNAFDRLIEAGERVRRAQPLQLGGKAADMRGALAARRESISELARLADGLLVDAGHNASADTKRRVTTTLEALSSYSSLIDGPRPGRLTDDVRAPGFESLAALVPGPEPKQRMDQPSRVVPFQPAVRTNKNAAAARAELKEAERILSEAQIVKKSADLKLQKAIVHAGQTEAEKRQAEDILAKARSAVEEAGQRMRNLTAEAEKAARALRDAERVVEKARKQLEEYET